MEKFQYFNAAVIAAKKAAEIAAILDVQTSSVKLGGSLALGLQIDGFSRDIHDIDLIVDAPDHLLKSLQDKCSALAELTGHASHHQMISGNDRQVSYIVGSMRADGTEHPVNVILQKAIWSDFRCSTLYVGDNRFIMMQHPTIIRLAKVSYGIRHKDTGDIRQIIDWEMSHRDLLPF